MIKRPARSDREHFSLPKRANTAYSPQPLMLRPRIALAMFVAVALLFAPGASAGPILLELQRLSDTQALITAGGSISGFCLDVDACYIFTLIDPFAIDPPAASNNSVYVNSGLEVGGRRVEFAYDFGAGPPTGGAEPALYIGAVGGRFRADDLATGSMLILLQQGSTLAPVGSSGAVLWGLPDSQRSQTLSEVGSWYVVDPYPARDHVVPEPTSLLLLGTGVAGLFSRRCRHSLGR